LKAFGLVTGAATKGNPFVSEISLGRELQPGSREENASKARASR
jgi:hypothetical protein